MKNKTKSQKYKITNKKLTSSLNKKVTKKLYLINKDNNLLIPSGIITNPFY